MSRLSVPGWAVSAARRSRSGDDLPPQAEVAAPSQRCRRPLGPSQENRLRNHLGGFHQDDGQRESSAYAVGWNQAANALVGGRALPRLTWGCPEGHRVLGRWARVPCPASQTPTRCHPISRPFPRRFEVRCPGPLRRCQRIHRPFQTVGRHGSRPRNLPGTLPPSDYATPRGKVRCRVISMSIQTIHYPLLV